MQAPQMGVDFGSTKRLFHRAFNLRYHPHIMLPFVIEFFQNRKSHEAQGTPAETVVSAAANEESDTTMLKTLGWISAGLGAVAIGLIVGRELRQRYKFNRRTPYDFYAHSGEDNDIEFGVGI